MNSELMPSTETISFILPQGRKIYFASDFHLGAGGHTASLLREKAVLQWLETIKSDAAAVFLVGDIFDYWFEYKAVVPKGYVRLLGKLASLTDRGVRLFYFTGNHDMWMRDYLHSELGAAVYRRPVHFEIQGGSIRRSTSLLVGHGDGLGPGDRVYKVLKRVFENPLARWSFRQVHPDLATRLAHAWAMHSRAVNNKKGEDDFKGPDKEWLYVYCTEQERMQHHDFYIFGHRHLALDLAVGRDSRYINLGEWFSTGSRYPYACYDGSTMALKFFKEELIS